MKNWSASGDVMSIDPNELDDMVLLLQDPAVSALAWDCPEEEARFVGLFHQTWDLLGSEPTSQILALWAADDCRARFCVLDPGQGGLDHDTLGMCRNCGRNVAIQRRALQMLPNDAFIGLLVHELAHVYGYAAGDPCHVLHSRTAREEQQRLDAAEVQVERWLRSWGLLGYDDALTAWIVEHPDVFGHARR